MSGPLGTAACTRSGLPRARLWDSARHRCSLDPVGVSAMRPITYADVHDAVTAEMAGDKRPIRRLNWRAFWLGFLFRKVHDFR